MSIKFGKTERKALIALIESAPEDDDECADELLALAVGLVEQRAKWTVVGQCRSGPNRGLVACLGMFSTERDAKTAAASFALDKANDIRWATLAAPVHHCTAAKLHQLFKPERGVDARLTEIRESVSAWQKQRECELLEWEASLTEDEKAALDERIEAVTEME